jgi:hypothetical protein
MDHLVCTDDSTGELEELIRGTRTMIARGVGERSTPYGAVDPGDTLYFTRSSAPGVVIAKAVVMRVVSSGWLTEKKAARHLSRYQDRLRLTKSEIKRWSEKRYLVLIAVDSVMRIAPFTVDKAGSGRENDWLLVGDIQEVVAMTVSPWLNKKRTCRDAGPAVGE